MVALFSLSGILTILNTCRWDCWELELIGAIIGELSSFPSFNYVSMPLGQLKIPLIAGDNGSEDSWLLIGDSGTIVFGRV